MKYRDGFKEATGGHQLVLGRTSESVSNIAGASTRACLLNGGTVVHIDQCSITQSRNELPPGFKRLLSNDKVKQLQTQKAETEMNDGSD